MLSPLLRGREGKKYSPLSPPGPFGAALPLKRGGEITANTRAQSLRGPAAIQHQRGSGDQRRGVGGEKPDGAGDLVELAEPAELNLGQHFVTERFVLEKRPRHRRLKEGRTDAIDADIVRGELDRHRLSEALHRALEIG